MTTTYGYIAETDRGDVPFSTPTHHEVHHNSFHEWFLKYKPEIDSFISVLGQGVQLLGIHTARQGQRLEKIAGKS